MFQPSLEIIVGNLPAKMTSTNEFVPVMKQNIPVIFPISQKCGIQLCNANVKIIYSQIRCSVAGNIAILIGKCQCHTFDWLVLY
jgi:hypothetical protein